ncbi:MAG: carbonic anhydrase [Granulosicoccus sp.]
MTTANEALNRLKAGNDRFVADVRDVSALTSKSRLAEILEAQQPFAIILGCSDSRVPAEIVFDQGLGDLFVIRVAGNIVTPSQLGSVEFSALQHGARLVVVMGHTNCGAIQATVEELKHPSSAISPNLQSIVDCIQPSVEKLVEEEADESRLISLATRANVRASVSKLKNSSEVLNDLISNDGMQIVGAEYSLETGKVQFFKEGDGDSQHD